MLVKANYDCSKRLSVVTVSSPAGRGRTLVCVLPLPSWEAIALALSYYKDIEKM